MKKNNKGFTLAELLIVVAVIAVLVAVAIPTFANQLEKSRQAVDIANLRGAYAAAQLAVLDMQQFTKTGGSKINVIRAVKSFNTTDGSINEYVLVSETDSATASGKGWTFYYDPDTGALIAGDVSNDGDPSVKTTATTAIQTKYPVASYPTGYMSGTKGVNIVADVSGLEALRNTSSYPLVLVDYVNSNENNFMQKFYIADGKVTDNGSAPASYTANTKTTVDNKSTNGLILVQIIPTTKGSNVDYSKMNIFVGFEQTDS